MNAWRTSDGSPLTGRRRHRLLHAISAALVAASLIACGGDAGASGDPTDPAPESDSTTTSVATTVPTTTTTLPAPIGYTPLAGEMAPDAKQVASDIVVAAASYPVGDGTVEAAADRLSAIGADPALAEQMAALLVADAAASAEIVYPQLGGLTASDVAVILVVRQWLNDGQGLRSVTRTLDIRTSLVDGRWAVTAIPSTGGSPPTTPTDLSDAARRVLESPALDLPDSSRWDIEAGRMDDRTLLALLDAATVADLSVTVLISGHSPQVFGTNRTSNHAEGRAVDIWAIDGIPVISLRDQGSPAFAVAQRLFDGPVDELGSPWAFGAGRSFTDDLHQDHLHLGFDR